MAETTAVQPAAAPPPRRFGTLYARGSATEEISDAELAAGLREALEKLGPRHRVLLLPPDITRLMSKAGELACAAYEYYGEAVADVMPTLGTHTPMSASEVRRMYPSIPLALFREHDWRKDTVVVGTVPADTVSRETGGAIAEPWEATLNTLVVNGGHDLVLSMGQVVPHEALGMANFTKNLFIGVAGERLPDPSHPAPCQM
jgi:nickel-dependent lactate racemase